MSYHPKGCSMATKVPGSKTMEVQLLFSCQKESNPIAYLHVPYIKKQSMGMDEDYHWRVRRVYVKASQYNNLLTFEKSGFSGCPSSFTWLCHLSNRLNEYFKCIDRSVCSCHWRGPKHNQPREPANVPGVIVLEIPSSILLHLVQNHIHVSTGKYQLISASRLDFVGGLAGRFWYSVPSLRYRSLFRKKRGSLLQEQFWG